MGTHIHKFNSENDYNNARTNNYVEPWVSKTILTNSSRIDYNKTEEEKLLDTPLTFEILGSGKVFFNSSASNYNKTIEYKKNDGEWTSTISSHNNISFLDVITGDLVQFRGNNDAYSNGMSYTYFNVNCEFNVSGNIMSLISSSNFSTLTTLPISSLFLKLFEDNVNLIDASRLLLPATTLTNSCYRWMFSGCTSLTTAPILPAETLMQYCYGGMFYNCPNLNYIKCLAKDITAYNATDTWVFNVASNGTFIKSNESTWTTGQHGIPEGWTVVDA